MIAKSQFTSRRPGLKWASLFAAYGLVGSLLALPGVAQPPAAPVPVDDLAIPKGVDVQARGPIHEAFATPTAESGVAPVVAKKPPAAIEEMPPAEKPEGDVVWIGGYWHWDDDRQDFLWVSGCWRTLPPGRQWVAGYWREQGPEWQWVGGFWAAAEKQAAKPAELTYYPDPPAPPQVAPPGAAPNPDSFYMPGQYAWRDGRYVWVAGYWARVQPGYVWVPGHYRWTPYGYVYVAGYWDFALARRGLLYAPVYVNVAVVGPGFVYTPAYAVSDVVIVDALWVRPAHCHYYFGDYYGVAYRGRGFECCVVYSQRHYDSIIVYRGWECRNDPRWHETQVNIFIARDGGRAPCPPRTLVEQRIMLGRNGGVGVVVVLAPARQVAAERGFRVVAISREARMQEKVRAETLHREVVHQRQLTESGKVGAPGAPRTARMPLPQSHPAGPAAAPLHGPVPPSGIHPPQGKGPVTPAKGAAKGSATPPGKSPPPNQQHPPAQQQRQGQDPPKGPG